MLIPDACNALAHADTLAVARANLVKAADLDALWASCAALITSALPCHSCSLLFDIQGFHPLQGRHHLPESGGNAARLATSLDVAAPYLTANPRVRWYTFSQIASQDAAARARLEAQDQTPGWHEFIHLAFWDATRLEAVLSIRIRAGHTTLSDGEAAFLMDLYPLLDASLQRIRALERERARSHAFETLLHEFPLPAVLVDGDLVPGWMSLEASRLCRRWSGDAEADGRLPRAIETPLRQWLESGAVLPQAPGNRTTLTLQHPQRPDLRLRLEISSAPGHSARSAQHLLILAADGPAMAAVDTTSPRVLQLLKSLSPSERKVAALVAAGLRNGDIAQQLCRSRKTIESQVSSIFRKLDVANRTQLARLLG